jgi:hypothetical protein
MSSRPKAKPKVSEAHRLVRDGAGQEDEVGPADAVSVLLLEGREQPAGLVEVAVVGPGIEGAKRWLPVPPPPRPSEMR